MSSSSTFTPPPTTAALWRGTKSWAKSWPRNGRPASDPGPPIRHPFGVFSPFSICRNRPFMARKSLRLLRNSNPSDRRTTTKIIYNERPRRWSKSGCHFWSSRPQILSTAERSATRWCLSRTRSGATPRAGVARGLRLPQSRSESGQQCQRWRLPRGSRRVALCQNRHQLRRLPNRNRNGHWITRQCLSYADRRWNGSLRLQLVRKQMAESWRLRKLLLLLPGPPPVDRTCLIQPTNKTFPFFLSWRFSHTAPLVREAPAAANSKADGPPAAGADWDSRMDHRRSRKKNQLPSRRRRRRRLQRRQQPPRKSNHTRNRGTFLPNSGSRCTSGMRCWKRTRSTIWRTRLRTFTRPKRTA